MKNRNLRAPLAALPLAILATIFHARIQVLPETAFSCDLGVTNGIYPEAGRTFTAAVRMTV